MSYEFVAAVGANFFFVDEVCLTKKASSCVKPKGACKPSREPGCCPPHTCQVRGTGEKSKATCELPPGAPGNTEHSPATSDEVVSLERPLTPAAGVCLPYATSAGKMSAQGHCEPLSSSCVLPPKSQMVTIGDDACLDRCACYWGQGGDATALRHACKPKECTLSFEMYG